MNYKKKFWGAFLVLAIASLLVLGIVTKPFGNKLEGPAVPDYWPKIESAIAKNEAIEKRVLTILSNMTVEQKVAQIIQPEIKSFTAKDMRKYGFGSYLNGASTFPLDDKNAEVQDWVSFSQSMFAASVDASLDGSSIPTMWATDAVHGHAKIRGATTFPHNIGLGAANNPELLEEIARVTAIEVNVTGIDWVFAPTVTTPRNDRWGRTYEGYSEDPKIVTTYAEAFIRGMQGKLAQDDKANSKSIATLKHFVGDGGTLSGIDQGDNRDTESDLFETHAQGYVTGLEAGAQTVMASFNSWHGDKMHGNEYLLTQVLKKRMGFDGVVVGDWNGHGQVDGCSNESCPQAFNAGVDVFMVAGDAWKPLYENTLKQVASGVITKARLDDAVARMLRVKLRFGLFEKAQPIERALVKQPELLGSKQHRQLAQQAVRESLVLLKNNQQLLPLSAKQHILMAGDGADNIGKQTGAWTISWQSTDNQNSDFPKATSIYAGIKRQVEKAGGSVELNIQGNYTQKPDVAIVVFGEEPYAEGVGDRDSIEYQAKEKKDLALLKKLKAENIPVVSLFISGRPMWVNPEINQSDAFVAVWLPGSEGEGIADVILRNKDEQVQFDFKGKLSFSWPKSVDQAQLNIGEDDYDPLFEYAYGLQYSDNQQVELLDENSGSQILGFENALSIFDKNFTSSWYTAIVYENTFTQVDSNQYKNSGIEIKTIDKNVQEDARQIRFTGKEKLAFSVASEQVQDIAKFVESGYVKINLLIDSKPNEAVFMKLNCNGPCGKSIELSHLFNATSLNEWKDISVPLSCFNINKEDAVQLTSPLVIETAGEFTFSFSSLSIEDGAHKTELTTEDASETNLQPDLCNSIDFVSDKAV